MTTLRIRVDNSFDGSTLATEANTSLNKVAGNSDYWTLGTNTVPPASLSDIGVIPLSLLADLLSSQDYMVRASLPQAPGGVTDFSVTPVVIESGGGLVLPMGPARSGDPNVDPFRSEIHLSGLDYGLQIQTTGATGVQILVLEFEPLERPAQISYAGGAADGDGTDPASTATDNVQLETAVNLLSATAASYRYVHSGATKRITKISSVIQEGTITGGAATITATIVGVGAVGNGTLTIALGDTVNEVDSTIPTSNNVLTDGTVVLFVVGGTNTASPSSASVSFELTP